MILCPHDHQPCAMPRCSVCPLPSKSAPVSLRAAEARTALLTVAAMHGGAAVELMDWHGTTRERIGYAWLAPGTGAISFPNVPTWVWGRLDHLFGWRCPSALGHTVIALGRIDRGLGAARPDMKPPRRAAIDDAAHRGGGSPTTETEDR